MTVPPVAGDFLAAAGRHIAAAVDFHGELPDCTQRAAVYQISRMTATIARLLADLPDEFGPSPDPEREAGAPVVTARLALARAAHRLRPVAASGQHQLTRTSIRPLRTWRPRGTTWPPAATCYRLISLPAPTASAPAPRTGRRLSPPGG